MKSRYDVYGYEDSNGNTIWSDSREELLNMETHTGTVFQIMAIPKLPEPPCSHPFPYQREDSTGRFWYCDQCSRALKAKFEVKNEF